MGEIKIIKELVQNKNFRKFGEELVGTLSDCFISHSGNVIKLFSEIGEVHNIHDEFLFDNFKKYLTELNKNNPNQNSYSLEELYKLAIMIAEATPNEESGYEGNDEKLRNIAKRLIKLIDDFDSDLKAVYLANLSRAVLNGYIRPDKFFKLSNCLRRLTDEDLSFIKNNISEGSITNENELNLIEDYIDDFRSLGLLYEVDGGFAFSKRAFELRAFSLDYEKNYKIPKEFPERQILVMMSEEDYEEALA